MATIWDLMKAAARERPDEIILRDNHGRALAVTDLLVEAERTAAGLLERGVAAGRVVSWQLPTTVEAMVIMLACARLGAVQNPIIPFYREREVRMIADQVGPSLIVVPSQWRGVDHAGMVRALGHDPLVVDLEHSLDLTVRLPSRDPASLPPPPSDGDQPRWIYYSSGTTSEPKGARHSDHTLIAGSNGFVDHLEFRSGDVFPIAWPIAHIGGVTWLASVLRRGGTLVLFDEWSPTESPLQMADFDPTVLGSAPPFLRAHVDAQHRHGATPLYPRLRVCVSGGTPLPAQVQRDVDDAFHVPTLSGWGLTEFPNATLETPRDQGGGYAVGRPVKEVLLRSVDGELRLKGPQCFLGYVDERRTTEAFDEEGWFRTGDLGDIDADGRASLLGRLKDVIIRNAENISAREVEEVLLTHDQVSDVAVVGIPHRRTGEQACAFVVPAGDGEPTFADIVQHCIASGLAKFKCPEQVQIVSSLPRDGMGKVQKRVLAATVEEAVS